MHITSIWFTLHSPAFHITFQQSTDLSDPNSRIVKTLPCITVYMSSLTNMAIALDRYRVIVKPDSPQVTTGGAWLLLPVISLLASALSFPITYKTKLVSLKQFLVIS